jgi:hypothetical protein
VRAIVRALAAVTTLGSIAAWSNGAAHGATSGTDTTGGTITVGATGGHSGGGVPSNPGVSGGKSSGTAQPVCTYTSLVLNDEGGFAPGGPTPGGWYSVTCSDLATGNSVTETIWIANQTTTSPAPAADPYAVALEAENSIELPKPDIHVNPPRTAVVNLPTWLWTDASNWHAYSVSASIGSVSATAVATPVSIRWSMGDGGTVTCTGPGTSFDPQVSAKAQVTDCSYDYSVSSAGQPSPDEDPNDGSFVVTATVTWSVSWSSAGAAAGGTLPTLFTSTSTHLRVEQVESLITNLAIVRVSHRPHGRIS